MGEVDDGADDQWQMEGEMQNVVGRKNVCNTDICIW